MNILYGININYGISLPLIVCPCWLLLFLPFKDALLGEIKGRRSRPLCPTRIASKSTLLCIDRLVSGAVEHFLSCLILSQASFSCFTLVL